MSSQDAKKVIDSLKLITISADPVEMVKIFGPRFNDAWALINDRKIQRIIFKPSGKVIWIVQGNHKDYQILPNAAFCTCHDFYFNVIDGKAIGCKHLIAQKLAGELLEFEKIELHDSKCDQFQEDLRKQHLLTLGKAERDD